MRTRHLSVAALAVSASLGLAGCVTQPWDLPDPYPQGTPRSAPYYGSGSYGYGSGYGYGYRYADPYSPYYRSPYPSYGYAYPYVPGGYCRDADRDGRCDHVRDDDDDSGGGAAPQPGSKQPLRDLRRLLEERERATTPQAGATTDAAVVSPTPTDRPRAGATPAVRRPTPPAVRPQARPQPRVDARPRSEPAGGAARRAPRAEHVPTRGGDEP